MPDDAPAGDDEPPPPIGGRSGSEAGSELASAEPRSDAASASSGSEPGAATTPDLAAAPSPPELGSGDPPAPRVAVRGGRRSRWIALGLAAVAALVATVLIAPWSTMRRASVTPSPVSPPGPLLPLDRPTVPSVVGPAEQRLAGLVVDGLGQPVPGVAIRAAVEPLAAGGASDDTGVATAVAISAGDGRFELTGLPAGRYRIEVSGAGVFTAEVRFVPVPSDELRLVLARRVAIVGRVLDGGAGVPGALVAIDSDVLGEVRSTVTADDGSFGFADLPEGTYRAWGGKGDLSARAQAAPRLGRGPFVDVELWLEPATIVVGKVIDRLTGAGVAAAVMLTPSDDTAGDEAPRFARTDASGVFRIEAVPHGRWTADAWAPGWLTTGTVDFAAGRAVPTLELTPGGVIEGIVIDGAGRPVAGVAVAALERGGGREISIGADDDRLRRYSGRSRLPIADPIALDPVAAPADARFIARGELGVLLGPIPYPPAAGQGVVRTAAIVAAIAPPPPAGSADVAGTVARLGLSPPSVVALAIDPAYRPVWTTGADGRFRLVGVEAGDYLASGTIAGHPPARSRPLSVRPGQIVTGVELRLVDGVWVSGRVTDQHGAPITGALLAWSPTDDDERVAASADLPSQAQAITDADGRYRVGPLTGPMTVRASAFGHAEVTAGVVLAAAAVAGADHVHDVVLVVADAELVGQLDDPSGLPVVGARVEIEGGPADGRAATVGDGGRWTIAMLPPEGVTVRVEHPGYPPQRFAARPGAEARLRLVYGGGIEAVVFDRHTGNNLDGIAVAALGPGGDRRDLVTTSDGRLTLVPVVAGAWTLRIKIPGYLARATTVTVPAGDRPGQSTVRDLRLELERGALVAGLVRDRRGDRVAGARVWIARGDDEVAATTDALGEFRLRDVPTGKVMLRASRGASDAALELELRAGDERLAIDLALR